MFDYLQSNNSLNRMMPSLKMMSNDDIDYDDSAFGKRCICWSAFNGDISVAHTPDAESQFFIPPGGRLLISRISRYGICISCPCALPFMTYISFSTLFWWYTIWCGNVSLLKSCTKRHQMLLAVQNGSRKHIIALPSSLNFAMTSKSPKSGFRRCLWNVIHVLFFCSWLVNF